MAAYHDHYITRFMIKFALLFFSLFSPDFSRPSLSASVISYLPGFQGPLPFYLETGYVEVDEVKGTELFYYFVESERSPEEDPLLLWLTGGPRCSAFSGLVFEIGPLKFVTKEYNGSLPELVYHAYSWTKVANIIFSDSPVGSGFSFSRHPDGYDATDSSWSDQIVTFLYKWLHDHPRFIRNPLYIAGDSYAGKIAPIIVQQISDGIGTVGIGSFFNLKGYLIGNPVTGDKVDINSQVPYAHGVGIISDNFFKMTQRYCEGQDYNAPKSENCAGCINTFNKFTSEIEKSHILYPKSCPPEPSGESAESKDRRILNEIHPRLFDPPPIIELGCKKVYGYILSYYWANSDTVRQALGIKKGTVGEWLRCNKKRYPYTSDISSSIKFHFNVTSRGYRALIYSGDHDLVIPFVGTQEWISSLNFDVLDVWRSWNVEDEVAGYVTAYYNNLTFTTVKGAGHTAPEYKPKQCLAMLERWLSYKPL